MPYLPFVDGLRAVAIAAVVAFHALPQVMPGGFAGDPDVYVPRVTLTPLHGFAGSGSDGSNLSTLIQGRDGNFYGTTVTGGGIASSGHADHAHTAALRVRYHDSIWSLGGRCDGGVDRRWRCR